MSLDVDVPRGRRSELDHHETLTRVDGRPIRILVVDKEPLLTELMSMALRDQGWQVSIANDGASAIRVSRREPPDLTVLDVALPDTDGLSVMDAMREVAPKLPVVVLSGHDSVQDRITGLARGCDDYVGKPFSIEELVLRLRALIRRAGIVTDTNFGRVVVGDLVLDEYAHRVTRNGVDINLSTTEYRLLRHLMCNPGRVFAKTEILHEIWGPDTDRSVNLVELFISYLRKKIDDGNPRMIHTLRGAGYLLRAADRS